MACISIHVDDKVKIDPMTPQAISGGWPLAVAIESFCGEGEFRHTFQKDQINLHGGVDSLRNFANLILAALPAEDEAETEEQAADSLAQSQQDAMDYHAAKQRGEDV